MFYGGVAQLGERLGRNEKAAGSNPVTSIYFSKLLKIDDCELREILYDFPQPLLKGIYIKRLNRFTGILELENKIVKVHIPNSGRLEEALREGVEAYFFSKKGLKTEGVLQLVKNGEKFISIDARIPNKLMERLLAKKTENSMVRIKREAKINGKRIDFLIESSKKIWIETKSITLVEDCFGLFPDSPTPRGREHVKELIKIKENEGEGVIVFVVQREDAHKFSPNKKVDPEFSKLLKEAVLKGIKVLAFNCMVGPERISLNKKLEVIL